jgi:hypothetical protein
MTTEAVTEPAIPDLFEPCSSRNDWCVLPDGHPGRCRASLPGQPKPGKPHKRSATGRQTTASTRSRASKPSLMPALWTMVYARAGQAVEMMGPEPASPPAGRVMQFQAPAAGLEIHDALAHLPLYKRVSSFVGDGQGDGPLASILGLIAAPAVAGLMASNERLAEQMWPILAGALQTSAIAQAKAQKERLKAMHDIQEFQAEAAEALNELWDTLFAQRPKPQEATDASV